MFEPIDVNEVKNLLVPLAKNSTNYEHCLDKLTSHVASRNNFMQGFFDCYRKRHLLLEELEELLKSNTDGGSRTYEQSQYIRNVFKTVLDMFNSEGNVVSEYSDMLESTYKNIEELIKDNFVLQKTVLAIKLIEDKHELGLIEIKRQELKVMYDRCMEGL